MPESVSSNDLVQVTDTSLPETDTEVIQEEIETVSSNTVSSNTVEVDIEKLVTIIYDKMVSENTVETELDATVLSTVSDNMISDNTIFYDNLEEFTASTVDVDLYQYTILSRLEFIQYALCILIALLFLQLFLRKK